MGSDFQKTFQKQARNKSVKSSFNALKIQVVTLNPKTELNEFDFFQNHGKIVE